MPFQSSAFRQPHPMASSSSPAYERLNLGRLNFLTGPEMGIPTILKSETTTPLVRHPEPLAGMSQITVKMVLITTQRGERGHAK